MKFKKYKTPKLEIIIIELEETIAVSQLGDHDFGGMERNAQQRPTTEYTNTWDNTRELE